MNSKTAIFLNLSVSIIFAGLILLCSFIFKDSGHAQTIIFMLIALWWIPFSIMSSLTGRKKCGSCVQPAKQK